MSHYARTRSPPSQHTRALQSPPAALSRALRATDACAATLTSTTVCRSLASAWGSPPDLPICASRYCTSRPVRSNPAATGVRWISTFQYARISRALTPPMLRRSPQPLLQFLATSIATRLSPANTRAPPPPPAAAPAALCSKKTARLTAAVPTIRRSALTPLVRLAALWLRDIGL